MDPIYVDWRQPVRPVDQDIFFRHGDMYLRDETDGSIHCIRLTFAIPYGEFAKRKKKDHQRLWDERSLDATTEAKGYLQEINRLGFYLVPEVRDEMGNIFAEARKVGVGHLVSISVEEGREHVCDGWLEEEK